jgi:hypothetical protein
VAGYVLRLEDPSASWLTREMPTVTWGPKANAMTFKTKGDARRAQARLQRYGEILVEEV